jgi:hypothetical protein
LIQYGVVSCLTAVVLVVGSFAADSVVLVGAI